MSYIHFIFKDIYSFHLVMLENNRNRTVWLNLALTPSETGSVLAPVIRIDFN
jgi:hypothetical protein